MIKIGLCGASGRVGKELTRLINNRSQDFSLVASFSRSEKTDTIADLCSKSEVIIDFSAPDILLTLLEEAKKAKKILLIGTTGLSQEQFSAILECAKHIPILYAANTSLGANLLVSMAASISGILKEYDVEIIEAHHKHKKDAPSGTALMIGKAIADSRGVTLQEVATYGRSGHLSRQDGEIGFASLRAGGIFGDHEVIFGSDDELLTISHRALNRSVFASGALYAASWLIGKAPGLYSMRDVVSNDLSRFS